VYAGASEMREVQAAMPCLQFAATIDVEEPAFRFAASATSADFASSRHWRAGSGEVDVVPETGFAGAFE
jgi:hypothetical protein